jgi:spore germination protein KB
VLARVAEVFIVILFLMGITGNLFVYLSGNIDVHNLSPFLENGWKPVLSTAFRAVFFPFGEMLVFSMLIPYLNRPESIKKIWLSAIVSSGLIISYTTALNITVLGVGNFERATFPLLSTIATINLFDFIQRLDAIVVFTFLLTVFFKAAMYFYGTVIGIADLFKITDYRLLVFPIGVILICFSMIIASSYTGHIEEGRFVTPYYIACYFSAGPSSAHAVHFIDPQPI